MLAPLVSMAFVTGFLGSAHCVGMCGSIVAALALAGRRQNGDFVFHLFYNSGRLMTYTVVGLLVGWLGSALAYTRHAAWLTRSALVVSDLFVIAVGVATLLALPRFNIMRLESAAPVSFFTGVIRRLAMLPGGLAALSLGLLMGFLPCGFLYAMFLTAAQSASPLAGAGVMLAFGLGTLPALLLFGTAAAWLTRSTRGWMLRVAGGMVIAMGITNLFRHVRMIDWIMAAVPYLWECCP